MAVEVKIPTAGESITQVRIGEWRKSAGDYVESGEILCELETDKAAMELPAPSAGVLAKIIKQAGEDANVGDVIANIDEKAERPAGAAKGKAAAAAAAGGSGGATSGASTGSGTALAEKPGGEAHVMPAAARVMAEQGLKPGDVKGTGPGGRVLKEDAQRAAEAKSAASAAGPAASAASQQTGNGRPSGLRHEEVAPMSMLRRRIAERLVEAQRNAAILTTFNEVDMSAVMKLREQRQDEFVKRYGIKLGFMSFFVKAAIDALKHFPAVNGEIRGTDIVYKHYYDVGVAVSTERGLVVPVIRNAELLSFAEIEQKIAELAQRARDRKLEVEELQGGTFTISNGGVFGSLMSTPILNPPQSGILGLHAIQERPVARDGQVVIRPMMYVALSYDHRLVDGRESVSFLKRIKECVEDPTRMLIEA